MRYYPQLHRWRGSYLIALLAACGCLLAAFGGNGLEVRFSMFLCGIFASAAARMLWKSRDHYLDIGPEWIIHEGSRKWKVRRSQIMRIEQGRKSWVEEFDPYLTIHASGQEYPVDGGFLTDRDRIDELVRALEGDEGPRTSAS